MAQTTPYASFQPVFVITFIHVLRRRCGPDVVCGRPHAGGVGGVDAAAAVGGSVTCKVHNQTNLEKCYVDC